MNRSRKNLLLIAFVGLFCGATAKAGKETGNGGDPVALQFKQAAREAVANVLTNAPSYPETQQSDLSLIVDKSTLIVSDRQLPIPHGDQIQISTAENWPSTQTIVLSRKGWLGIKTAALRRAFALHEILGLAGLESTGKYPISTRYLGWETGLQIPNQMFNCRSIAQIWDRDRKIATDEKMVRLDWQSSWIGGAPYVTHQIGGKSYIAWIMLQILNDPSANLRDLSVEYDITKTTRALETELGHSTFDVFNSPFPSYFETAVASPLLKFPDGSTLIFSLICKSQN